MKKIICLLCICFTLVGCNAKDDSKTLVCTGVTSEVIEVLNTITYKEDVVLTQTIENKVVLSDLNLDKEMMESLVEQYSSAYDIEGVTYSYAIDEEGVFTEKIVVDFEKADFSLLQNAGLIDASTEGEIKYISFKQTKEALENFGMTCK